MKKAFCGMVLAGVMGAGAWAQDGTDAETSAQQQAAIAQVKEEAAAPKISPLNKATKLVGSTVVNDKGEEVGQVQELVIDLENGQLGYVVVALKDGKTVPMPPRALKAGEGNKHLVLNMSEKVLAVAEGYKETELPAADSFAVESAVGSAAASEQGSGSSEQRVEQGEKGKDGPSE